LLAVVATVVERKCLRRAWVELVGIGDLISELLAHGASYQIASNFPLVNAGVDRYRGFEVGVPNPAILLRDDRRRRGVRVQRCCQVADQRTSIDQYIVRDDVLIGELRGKIPVVTRLFLTGVLLYALVRHLEPALAVTNDDSGAIAIRHVTVRMDSSVRRRA